MGWFSKKSESYTEELHSAWQRCQACPNKSRAGAINSPVNCISNAIDTYKRVSNYYEGNYDTVEYEFARLHYYRNGDSTLWVCCGEATSRNTRVARVHHGGERRRVDHHVLVVSVVTGRGFFGGERWAYVVYDDDDGVGFDSQRSVKEYLIEKYSDDAIGDIKVEFMPFSPGEATRRKLADLLDDF